MIVDFISSAGCEHDLAVETTSAEEPLKRTTLERARRHPTMNFGSARTRHSSLRRPSDNLHVASLRSQAEPSAIALVQLQRPLLPRGCCHRSPSSGPAHLDRRGAVLLRRELRVRHQGRCKKARRGLATHCLVAAPQLAHALPYVAPLPDQQQGPPHPKMGFADQVQQKSCNTSTSAGPPEKLVAGRTLAKLRYLVHS